MTNQKHERSKQQMKFSALKCYTSPVEYLSTLIYPISIILYPPVIIHSDKSFLNSTNYRNPPTSRPYLLLTNRIPQPNISNMSTPTTARHPRYILTIYIPRSSVRHNYHREYLTAVFSAGAGAHFRPGDSPDAPSYTECHYSSLSYNGSNVPYSSVSFRPAAHAATGVGKRWKVGGWYRYQRGGDISGRAVWRVEVECVGAGVMRAAVEAVKR